MPYHVRITTSNQNLEPSNGGFHEIHESRFLSSPRHVVEIVRTVIILNRVYSSNIPLRNVEVETTNPEVIAELSRSYLEDYFGIPISYNLVDKL